MDEKKIAGLEKRIAQLEGNLVKLCEINHALIRDINQGELAEWPRGRLSRIDLDLSQLRSQCRQK